MGSGIFAVKSKYQAKHLLTKKKTEKNIGKVSKQESMVRRVKNIENGN